MTQSAIRDSNTKVVPSEFSTLNGSSKRVLVNRGRLNKVRLRPHTVGEHVESSREIQATVASGLIAGQAFQPAIDNIHGLGVTLAIGGTATDIDNFELYADSAALRLKWIKTGQNADLEEVIVSPNSSSSKSMALKMKNAGDEWAFTFAAPVDMTNQQIAFDSLQTVPATTASVDLFLSDGTNTKSVNISTQFPNLWTTSNILESALSDDGGTSPTITAITKIGFRVRTNKNNEFIYIDNMTYSLGEGNVTAKLYNMGASIPVSGVTSIDDGTQYTTLGDLGISGVQVASIDITLRPGINSYHLEDFSAGVAKEIPANVVLTPNNYYIFTLTYVDVNVSVYGPDTSFAIKYYTNGFAFTTPNTATAITAIGAYSDLAFTLEAVASDSWVSHVEFQALDSSGEKVTPHIESRVTVYVENAEMTKDAPIVMDGNGLPSFVVDLKEKPARVMPGGKVECYYTSAPNDTVDSIVFLQRHYDKGVDTNG